MKNIESFLKQVLQDKQIMDNLFCFEEWYEKSYFEEDMHTYSEYENLKDYETMYFYKKNEFIAKNTEWLFIDLHRNLYGLLDKFVVLLDHDGELSYFCNEFQNIPLIIFKNEDELIKNKIIENTKKNGFKYNDLMNDYKKLCKQYNLELNLNYEEEEFNKYIESKIN